MKKKLILCVLLASCVLALTACNQTPAGSETASAPDTAETSLPKNSAEESSQLTEEQQKALAELEKMSNTELSYPYQKSLIYGWTDADTPKITIDEVRKIAKDMEAEVREKLNGDYQGNGMVLAGDITDEILIAISKIQSYPDKIFGCGMVYYYFWPDANTEQERKQEILVSENGDCEVSIRTYDDNNQLIKEEVLINVGAMYEAIRGNLTHMIEQCRQNGDTSKAEYYEEDLNRLKTKYPQYFQPS